MLQRRHTMFVEYVGAQIVFGVDFLQPVKVVDEYGFEHLLGYLSIGLSFGDHFSMAFGTFGQRNATTGPMRTVVQCKQIAHHLRPVVITRYHARRSQCTKNYDNLRVNQNYRRNRRSVVYIIVFLDDFLRRRRDVIETRNNERHETDRSYECSCSEYQRPDAAAYGKNDAAQCRVEHSSMGCARRRRFRFLAKLKKKKLQTFDDRLA